MLNFKSTFCLSNYILIIDVETCKFSIILFMYSTKDTNKYLKTLFLSVSRLSMYFYIIKK